MSRLSLALAALVFLHVPGKLYPEELPKIMPPDAPINAEATDGETLPAITEPVEAEVVV